MDYIDPFADSDFQDFLISKELTKTDSTDEADGVWDSLILYPKTSPKKLYISEETSREVVRMLLDGHLS